ncbi:MAG: hypothetical protein AAGA41_07855 [Pseudomonadota bacterium]
MMARQWLLLQREIWEHKALYYAPLAVAGLLVFGFVVSFVTALAQGMPFDVAVVTLELTGAPFSVTGGAAILGIPFLFLNLVLGVVVFLYGIDALYAERKDKSILFWRSMPVTDTETVISKLITAVVAAPLITTAVVIATQVVLLVLVSLVLLIGGGSPVELLLAPLPFIRLWFLFLWILLTSSIWFAPVVAWFLLCSAFAKRSVLIWVFVPWIVLGMLESIVMRTGQVWQLIGERFSFAAISGLDFPAGINVDDDAALEALIKSGDFDVLGVIAPIKFLTDPGLWGGLIVTAIFLAGAVYCRRFRS